MKESSRDRSFMSWCLLGVILCVSIFINPIFVKASSWDDYIAKGRAAYQTGKNQEAESIFRQALFFLESFQWKKAIDYFSRGLALNPNDDFAYQFRGRAYFQDGQYKKAVDDFTKSIKLCPKEALTYEDRSNAYDRLGKHNLATKDHQLSEQLKGDDLETELIPYNQVIKLNPQRAENYLARADVYAKHVKCLQAIDDYTKSISLNPNQAETYIKRAKTYELIQEFQKAIDDYSRAIDLSTFTNTAVSMANKVWSSNSFIEAINRKNVNVYVWRARDHELLREYQQAINDYGKAYDLDHANKYVLCDLGRIYFQSGNYDKAIESLSKAINQDANFEEPYSLRAQVYEKLGQNELARKDQDKRHKLGYKLPSELSMAAQYNEVKADSSSQISGDSKTDKILVSVSNDFKPRRPYTAFYNELLPGGIKRNKIISSDGQGHIRVSIFNSAGTTIYIVDTLNHTITLLLFNHESKNHKVVMPASDDELHKLSEVGYHCKKSGRSLGTKIIGKYVCSGIHYELENGRSEDNWISDDAAGMSVYNKMIVPKLGVIETSLESLSSVGPLLFQIYLTPEDFVQIQDGSLSPKDLGLTPGDPIVYTQRL